MNTLLSAKFITSKKGWVTGEKGLLHTNDGGENWELQESGTEEDLLSIAFINDKMGWAVGDEGKIIHTIDGGKTWVSQGDYKASLYKVFFIDEKNGWAAGEKGTVLRTLDGGGKWEVKEIGIKRSIASLYFLNVDTGWILAGNEVYRTTDGGQDWKRIEIPVKLQSMGMIGGGPMPGARYQQIPQEWFQGDIYFANEKTGWAVLGLWQIYHTDDGGNTWNDQATGGYMSYGLGRLSFIDEKKGCAAGSSILCTEDGGKTWKERLGIGLGERRDIDGFVVSVWGLSFPDATNGWAVGNDGQIIVTTDGGFKWTMKTRKMNEPYFFNANVGFRMEGNDRSEKRYISRTDDGGVTWRQMYVLTDEVYIDKFYFQTEAKGWALGEKYDKTGTLCKILYTDDGGKNWTLRFEFKISGDDPLSRLYDINFINNNIGWVVGSNGTILHTRDSGKNWVRQKSGTKLHLFDVYFIDNNIGFALGDNGEAVDSSETNAESIILYTNDGGRNWRALWSRSATVLLDLFDVGNSCFYILGEEPDGAFLLSSNDNGLNWKKSNIGKHSLTSYQSACFVNESNGALFLDGNLILVTYDDGKTWFKKNKPLRKYPWACSEIFEK